jgi:hypothetical protein
MSPRGTPCAIDVPAAADIMAEDDTSCPECRAALEVPRVPGAYKIARTGRLAGVTSRIGTR